ncbi:MAG: hypothetical protein E6G39_01950, partial [Actinobacteria bacterium]
MDHLRARCVGPSTAAHPLWVSDEATFIENVWWPALASSTLKATTVNFYRQMSGFYVLPHIGQLRLDRIEPTTLVALYRELRVNGRRQRRGGLSERVLGNVHVTLTAAFSYAQQHGLIQSNPAKLVHRIDRPSRASRQQKTRAWNAEEARAAIDAARTERLGIVVL